MTHRPSPNVVPEYREYVAWDAPTRWFHWINALAVLALIATGLDAVVFCGGIGEHAWQVRERVLEGMEWIGIELDRTANRASAQVISSDRSRVRVFVIPTNEEAMIARQTLAVLDRAVAAAA